MKTVLTWMKNHRKLMILLLIVALLLTAFLVIRAKAREAMAGAFIEGKPFGEIVDAAEESMAKSSFELVTEAVGETLGGMAGDASSIKMNGKNIYNITVGNSDIVQTGFNDLTAMVYDSSAEALDKSSKPTKSAKKEGKCHMNKQIFLIIPLVFILLFCAACGAKDMPPDSSLPEPNPHDGLFTSEYGTMTFNGDGESITFDFTLELAEATGLPGGEQSGSYVFLFQHGQWRYDKAERFRLSASGSSYDFINDFTVTDENAIALQSPLNGEETILFIKGEN